MNGYNNKELSISLEKHYDRTIADLEKLMLTRFDATREAIAKADKYAEYRDNKQNEFRGSLEDVNQRLADQAKNFATKTELDDLRQKFEIWMSGIKTLQDANFNSSLNSIHELRQNFDKDRDKREGKSIVWPWVITIVSILITVGMTLFNLLK
jgi:hypothetical protein